MLRLRVNRSTSRRDFEARNFAVSFTCDFWEVRPTIQIYLRIIKVTLATSSFCGFRNFLPRLSDEFFKFNVHRRSHPQNGFQSWIAEAAFDVADHLRRQAGFLRDEVFGQLAPLPLHFEQRDRLDANGLCFSIHRLFLHKKSVDSTFHHSAIISRCAKWHGNKEKIESLI